MKYKVLIEDVKSVYREQLKRDLEKDFDEEFIRTTNLEKKLINEYGFEGIKLIFEQKNSVNYFNLGHFPDDCPWYGINHERLEDGIEAIFLKIRSKLPNLILSMKERCKFIFTEKKEKEWRLHYLMDAKLYDGRNYYRIYTGRMPLYEFSENLNLLKYSWSLPKDLGEFYSIHNGFGEIDDANFILSNEQIAIMGEMMNPICKEQRVNPDGYKFDDLLEFFPDGAGNTQCFLRENSENNITVDWDHETWEISDKLNFYEFVDERMSEIDEE